MLAGKIRMLVGLFSTHWSVFVPGKILWVEQAANQKSGQRGVVGKRRMLTGDKLKVVWAKFSTLSWAFFCLERSANKWPRLKHQISA
jgi:hypothetical protein